MNTGILVDVKNVHARLSAAADSDSKTPLFRQIRLLRIFITLFFLCLPLVAEATTTINEQFGPAVINQGDNSLYTITISNDSLAPLTNAMATVVLDNTSLAPNTSGGHITISSGTVLSNTCNFTGVTATAGTSKIVLTSGAVPAGTINAPSTCTFSINVTSITVGTYHAFIPATTTPDVDTAGYEATENGVQVQNTTPADITLQVNGLQPPTGNKTFSPSPAVAGDPTTLTITLTNPNAGSTMPLTSFTDNLPSGMEVASAPAATINCTGTGAANGTFNPNAGDTSLTLTGGTVGQGGACTLGVNVIVQSITGTTQVFNNTLAAGAIGNSRGLTSPAFNRNLTVNTPISVGKSFNPATIPSGQASLMTITITNNSTVNALNIASFTDSLTGSTLKVLTTASSPVAAAANPIVTCDGVGANDGLLSYTPDITDTSVTLTNATAGPKSGANGKCVITAYITSNVDGPHPNSIAADAVTNPNNHHSPSASATLNVNAQLTVNKTATLISVAPGQWTRFTVTINNWSGADVTNVSFRDDLPSNTGNQMVLDGVNPYSLSAGCSGGSWTGIDGDATLQWSGGTVVAGSGASPGVCTIVLQARLPITAVTGMTFSNQIPAWDGTNGVGGDGNGPGGHVVNPAASPVANVTTVDAVAVTKSFNPTSIAQGGTSTITLTIRNRVVAGTLTAVNLTDNFPAGITLAANPAAANTCGGTLQAFPGGSQLILTGGLVAVRPPANLEGTCTITVKVTGTTVGSFTNIIHPLDFSSSGGTVPGNVSATLNVTTGVTGSKSFSPASVTSGGISRVKITVTNSSNGDLTNVSVDDNTFSSGLSIANPANASTSCPGSPTLVVNPGATRAQLLGATMAAGTNCDFSFDVVTSGTGPWSNAIPIGKISSAEGPRNTAAVSATLAAVSTQININKSFNPVIVTGGVPSTLTLSLTNPSGATLHGIGFTDVFPVGIQVYSVPDVTSTCAGGTVTAIPGDGKVSLSGATMTAGSTCVITLQTTSVKFLNLTNSIPSGAVVSTEGYTNPSQVSATLSTLQGLGIMKAFSPAYVTPNTVTKLQMWLVSTFDPNAPTPLVLTGVSYTDTLPAGLVIAGVPNAATTCLGPGGAGNATVTADSGSSLVTVSEAQIAPGTLCSISVDVLAPDTTGAYTNIIPEDEISTDQGPTNSNEASAVLYVVNEPTISKAFNPTTVSVGGTSLLTVTINNGAGIPITGVSLSDTLPSGLAIAGTPAAATTCPNGIVTANPGTDTLSVGGATVPAGGACSFSARVAANTPGSYINNINEFEIISNEGLTNAGPANATLTVRVTPTVSKAFDPVSIAADGISTLTITLGNGNPASISLSSAFVDALPGNVFIAPTPNIVKTCTGGVTANPGGVSITYASGAGIPSGGCTISVDVTSNTPGVHTDTIAAGQLQTTTAGSNQDPAFADLAVGGVLVPPTVSKSFSPGTIDINGVSTLTITFGNPNDSSLTLSSDFTDTLPANVFVAGTPNASTTCTGGALTAAAGVNSITYSGGGIPGADPGPSGCTITVDVTSALEGSYTNTIPADGLMTDGGGNRQPATDGLVVQAPIPPTVGKSFSPGTINPGGVSRLTISLGNGNGGDISLSSDFADNLPAGVVAAPVPNIGGTCTAGSITANAGDSSITYAQSAIIPPGGCTILVDVTAANFAGSPYTNTIPVNSLHTSAGDNGAPATARLFVNPPQPPSISKSFSPATILAGATSTLTISLGNGNAVGTALTDDLVDMLPSNVVIAPDPNIQVGGGCTFDHIIAAAGGNSVTYQTGGAIPAGGCSIAVSVTSGIPSAGYVNTIAANALHTGVGNNIVGTSATLAVVAPDLAIVKTHSDSFVQGQTGATYTVTVSNNGTGDKTAGNTVTVTESAPGGMTVTAMSGNGWDCSVLPACSRTDILSAGNSYPPITVTVNIAKDAAANLVNSAGVSISGQLEPNTTDNTANDPTAITQLPDLTIVKTHVGDFSRGQTGAQYTITVTNSGSSAVSGSVSVTENAPGGLTVTAMSGNGWTCDLLPTCTRADALAAGSSYPVIAVTVDVAGDAAADLTNSTTVSLSGQSESDTDNNTAMDQTTIHSPNLFDPPNVIKTVDGSGLPVLRYTAVIINSGDGPALGAVFTDQVPANTSYVAGSITMNGAPVSDNYPDADGGYDAANQRIVINMGTIPPGGTVTMTFDVRVAAGFYGSISNQAAVSGTNFPGVVTDDPTTDAPGDPTVYEMPVAIPTMTEWGMIIFAVLAGLWAVLYLRKRKRAEV